MAPIQKGDGAADMIGGSTAQELSSTNTSLSFERTRMGADRTLMGIVRTSLSLIGFGFTIYKVFNDLAIKGVLPDADRMARRLGESLLSLGLLLLILGIASHIYFFRDLTKRRERLFRMGLLHHEITYKATPTFAVAFLLLMVGVAALASIIFNIMS